MKLIPMPKILRHTPEKITKKTIFYNCDGMDARLAKAVRKLPYDPEGLPLTIHIGKGKEESYILGVSNKAVVIETPSVAGAFYAIQTLRQLLENEKIYACHIEDAPDFDFRGFYHDITRGRVPTLETLKELVDYMAYMKLNSLQLYVEHSFAFREFADTMEKTGYLTAEEIRELDDYCYDNFIELVPSLSCFGHLYVLLEMPRYRHLQEAENFQNKQLYWQERMAHHTIDPTNPESFLLIKSLIDQFMPLFRTNKFNICCDETFDLRNGKHKDMDAGQLYITFTNKLIEYVKSCGKQVMMWGDIILQHPDKISHIPEDVVFLNWDYDAQAEKSEEKVREFYQQNREQIVCPATWAWNHFSESLSASIPNITNMTNLAKRYSAMGILNTNWGDYGDVCSLDLSLFGLAYGAARSWNVSVGADKVSVCADALIYRNVGTFDVLYSLNVIEHTVHYGDLSWIYNNLYYPGKLEVTDRKEAELRSALQQCLDLRGKLETQKWERDYFRQEILLAAEGVSVMAELMLMLRGYAVKRVTNTENWLAKYRVNWLKKNKESELKEIEKMFRLLEAAVVQGKTLQTC